MPSPPAGEAALRALSARFVKAEGRIRQLVAAAVHGHRRELLSEVLAILVALRRSDTGTRVIAAYVYAFGTVGNGGEPSFPNDLAGSLAQKLDDGAQTAGVHAREAFSRASEDNLGEMSDLAVLAHTDDRGASWSLARWASTNCETIGRQSTSRGLEHALGEGAHFVVDVGECQRCRELFSGVLVVGEDPLPPGHVNCTCVAKAA